MSRRKCAVLMLVALLVVLWSFSAEAPGQGAQPGSEWENAIRAFEESDKSTPPPLGAILFVGSSSIRMWDIPGSFPGLKVLNRGFGGSHISDCVTFASRIVVPYEPEIIVFYAGDNDINAGKTPETVLKDFKTFVRTVRNKLPDTRIIFISIKPSISRWHLVGKMRRANELIRTFVETDDRLEYLDVDTPMIGPDGKPRGELFVADGLHLSPAGYKLWTSLLLPHLTPSQKGANTQAPQASPIGNRNSLTPHFAWGKYTLCAAVFVRRGFCGPPGRSRRQERNACKTHCPIASTGDGRP